MSESALLSAPSFFFGAFEVAGRVVAVVFPSVRKAELGENIRPAHVQPTARINLENEYLSSVPVAS